VRADGEIIVLDAGTGFVVSVWRWKRSWDQTTVDSSLHTHWDHSGSAVLFPAYNSKNVIRSSVTKERVLVWAILTGQMETPVFPVSLRELQSHLAIKSRHGVSHRQGESGASLRIILALRRLSGSYQRDRSIHARQRTVRAQTASCGAGWIDGNEEILPGPNGPRW
jgi:hypothetical protein